MSSVFEHDSFDAITILIQAHERGPFTEFNALRFRALNQRCDHAAAFRVTGLQFKDAVRVNLRVPCRKTLPRLR